MSLPHSTKPVRVSAWQSLPAVAVAALMAMIWGFRANGIWKDERGVNLLDTGAHMYDTYECADGKWISIGSLEPQFYALLLEKTGLKDDADFAAQMNSAHWPALKERLTTLFKTRTRDDWCADMEMTDVCFAPVLSMNEAPHHPHNAMRGTFVEADGVMQPAPAPRYSATVSDAPRMTKMADTDAILAELGYDSGKVEALKAAGVVGMTITEVRGFGRQGGHTETYRGSEYQIDFVPKVRIELVVEDSSLERTLDVIRESASTGKIGDGKIWVTNVEQIIRIRTGEHGAEAI